MDAKKALDELFCIAMDYIKAINLLFGRNVPNEIVDKVATLHNIVVLYLGKENE